MQRQKHPAQRTTSSLTPPGPSQIIITEDTLVVAPHAVVVIPAVTVALMVLGIGVIAAVVSILKCVRWLI